MKPLITTILLSILFASCANSQRQQKTQLVGGGEGTEAILEFGDRPLTPTDTLPDFHDRGIQIKVQGKVYQQDGKTPAEGVILYVYHTNQEGIYAPKADSKGWEKRHGYIRGWVKTDKNGHYAYYTLQPAAYPSGREAAHIHYTILESNGKYYWLDSIVFTGDPLLTENETNPEAPRGGTPRLLDLKKEGDLMVGTKDIILGKNIPGYK
ncbi:intradiol ring-cleavage dioxygenase [Galbibacter sp. EGI 63066]|uniref:dioxygenase family protein n=1 Tax=Galbibacter sp. EGI 63066 TaxID=2993559 RepID=UPI0022493FCE|nr:intradiol ring-cleavage dioxygenase [Galbibacter sp. EGI 63066]MCX2679806.1 intradiol ring-cleavage dioxygenase [Galbibacter sp. EGI 63066]